MRNCREARTWDTVAISNGCSGNGRSDGRSLCHKVVGVALVSPCTRALATVSSPCLAAGFRALKSGISRPARKFFLTYPTAFSTRPFSLPLPTLHGAMVKPLWWVVYRTTADNYFAPKTGYNAPTQAILEGARPWFHTCFTTNSLCWLSSGSSSWCLSAGPGEASPCLPYQPHPSSPSASVLLSLKCSRV